MNIDITSVSKAGKYILIDAKITKRVFLWKKTTWHQFFTEFGGTLWNYYPGGKRVDLFLGCDLKAALKVYEIRLEIDKNLDRQLEL